MADAGVDASGFGARADAAEPFVAHRLPMRRPLGIGAAERLADARDQTLLGRGFGLWFVARARKTRCTVSSEITPTRFRSTVTALEGHRSRCWPPAGRDWVVTNKESGAYGLQARKCRNRGSRCQRRLFCDWTACSGSFGSRSVSTSSPASSSARK